ncbi:MAG: hypothetical protein ACKOXT_02440 [Actinomycetota bacterium]
MSDNFVGFARSPKPDKDRKVSSKEFVIHSDKPFSDCHGVFTTQGGVEKWLGEITKFDFRPGGKTRYKLNGEEFGATYASIRIPKQVVLITETLGEIVFSAKVKDSSFELTISFKKALIIDEKADWDNATEAVSNIIASELK